MNNKKYNIIWVDVETTGLGAPMVEDHLLEVGLRATDRDGTMISEGLWKIPNKNFLYFSELCTNDFVLRMHKKSGLASEYDTYVKDGLMAEVEYEDLISDVQTDLIKFFQKYTDGSKIPLAGSSVDFDRSWLKAYFPTLADGHFSHRTRDVSSMLEFCKLVNPELYGLYKEEAKERGESSHRPLWDLDDSIWKYEFMLDNFLHVYFTEEG